MTTDVSFSFLANYILELTVFTILKNLFKTAQLVLLESLILLNKPNKRTFLAAKRG
jgi:hypothetical protein